MTHLPELALVAALVGALGIGALATLSAPKPLSAVTMPVGQSAAPVRRAEPSSTESDAERIEALQSRIAAIAAEQRELAATIHALVQEGKRR
jgi:hypothetical protein